jgi:hypothetical protein
MNPALRYPLIYGLLSGTIIVVVITIGIHLSHLFSGFHSEWFGYLVMLVALTFIFVGMKRYRDQEKGGVIRFLPAFGLGLGIAVVAGLAYVFVWEGYLAISHYNFIDDYAASILRAQRAAGASPAKIAAKAAELQALKAQYANPLFRLPMTFMEIFPVGFVVALASAGLLRNPRFLPTR